MAVVVLAGVVMYFSGAYLAADLWSSEQGDLDRALGLTPDSILAARVETLVDSVTPSMRDMASELQRHTSSEGVVGYRAEEASGDQEWDGFARSNLQPGSYLATLSPGMSPSALFRNVHLNPSDLYIEPQVREELLAVFSVIQSQLQSIEVAHKETAVSEAVQLRQQLPHRVARPKRVVVSTDTESVTVDEYRPRGFQVFLPNGSDGMQIINQHDLPVTARVLELKAFTAIEIGEAVVAWFERIGLCPADEAAEIRADLHDAAGRFVRRREHSPR